MINHFYDSFIFIIGAWLIVFATFGPDRREPRPNLNSNDFFERVKRNPMNWIPTTLLLSVAAITISMGLIFVEDKETVMGYPLLLIGSLFAFVEIISRIKNFRKMAGSHFPVSWFRQLSFYL